MGCGVRREEMGEREEVCGSVGEFEKGECWVVIDQSLSNHYLLTTRHDDYCISISVLYQ